MAHFNFVISQNAKWGHAGFYIDCHRMTVPENMLLQKKAQLGFIIFQCHTHYRALSLGLYCQTAAEARCNTDLELSGGSSSILGPPGGHLVERLAVEVAPVGGVGRHGSGGRDVRVGVVDERRRGRLAREVAAVGRVADERRVGLRRTRVRLAARPHRCVHTHTDTRWLHPPETFL